MWELVGAILQAAVNGRRKNVQGEEEVEGKFHQVWHDSCIIVFQTEHIKFTWYLSPLDKGVVERGEGRTTYVMSLPKILQFGEMPGAGMPFGRT